MTESNELIGIRKSLLEIADRLRDNSGDDMLHLYHVSSRMDGWFREEISRWSLYLNWKGRERFRLAVAMMRDADAAFAMTKASKSPIECVKMCKAALILKGDF